MITRRAVDVAAGVAITSLSVLVTLIALKGIAVWPFASDRRDLEDILGAMAAPWLDGAEVAAWTPDLNRKAQSYFVVRQMPANDFRSWAAAVQLTVRESPSVPSGVFVLPEGVKLSRWLEKPADEFPGLDADGMTPRANVWSRWRDGAAYTVVHPSY